MDPLNLFRVDGLVAVVTGGGTGIGLMISRTLLTYGAAKVYILGRRLDTLTAASTANPGLIPLQCDITSKDSLQAAVDRVTRDVGYINLLVANSGILGPTATFSATQTVAQMRNNMFTNTPMEDFTHTFQVNSTATYFTLLAFLELLDAGNAHAVQNGGFGKPVKQGSKVPGIQSQVLVTSSVGAYLRDGTVVPAYMASKSALVALVKQASSGLAGVGVRVNALAPGFFPSEMADQLIASRDPETETVDNPFFIPARRFGGEEEMGGTVVYLASRAGAFCNGLVLLNDGGRLGVTLATY